MAYCSSLISIHGRKGTRSPSWRHQHQEWVGDIDGNFLEGNCHRGGGFCHSSTCSKTCMGFSANQIDNEAGNLRHCFLNYQGAYGPALGKVRMPWILLARNWPIWHELHDHQ